MRNYTNTLLFEGALDSIANTNNPLYNTSVNIFSPIVKIVSDDCRTSLGVTLPLESNLQGEVELATDTRLNLTRLIALSNAGNTSVTVRTLYTCISKYGVCQKCYMASRPAASMPTLGSSVRIFPEYYVDYYSITIPAGTTVLTLPHDISEYNNLYVFLDGSLFTAYSLSGNTMTLNSAFGSETSLLMKFSVITNTPYFYWLCRTYSGSLLGLKPLINIPFPIKQSLLASNIQKSDIKNLLDLLKNSNVSTQDFVVYASQIPELFEQAIYVILLCSIFLN